MPLQLNVSGRFVIHMVYSSWVLIPAKIHSDRDNDTEKLAPRLPRLTDQELQDYIRWQEQIKSSVERRVQTMNLVTNEEPITALKKYIPPNHSERQKAVVQPDHEETVGTSYESSPFAIISDVII